MNKFLQKIVLSFQFLTLVDEILFFASVGRSFIKGANNFEKYIMLKILLNLINQF